MKDTVKVGVIDRDRSDGQFDKCDFFSPGKKFSKNVTMKPLLLVYCIFFDILGLLPWSFMGRMTLPLGNFWRDSVSGKVKIKWSKIPKINFLIIT